MCVWLVGLTSVSTIPSRLSQADTSGSRLEGRLEVFYNNQWRSVCDETFGDDEARVVCYSISLGLFRFVTHTNTRLSLFKNTSLLLFHVSDNAFYVSTARRYASVLLSCRRVLRHVRREWALLSLHSVCLSGCLSAIPRPTAYHDWSITTTFSRPRTRLSLFVSPISHIFGARGKICKISPISHAYSCHCKRDASCHMICLSVCHTPVLYQNG